MNRQFSSALRNPEAAVGLIMERIGSTMEQVHSGLPHWADQATGKWTTTPHGDWPGGAWIGMLWCAAKLTGEQRLSARARQDLELLRNRLKVRSAFRGFPFYYGAALGDMLLADPEAASVAQQCADSLLAMFSPALGLIPLGSGAEEGSDIGEAISSIDSLQASPLLYWAFRRTGDQRYLETARAHTRRVIAIHERPGGSIVQSSELDPASGEIVRHFTHKGYSDDSVWGRAQAWGLLYAAMAAEWDDDRAEWIVSATRSAKWWVGNLPADGIAPWDFDDPKGAAAYRDTAATSIASVGLLKLAALTTDKMFADQCRDCAMRSLHAMMTAHLTPLSAEDGRPAGMLLDACFNNRPDSRPQDAVTSCEFIVGSYFFLQALLIATDAFKAAEF